MKCRKNIFKFLLIHLIIFHAINVSGSDNNFIKIDSDIQFLNIKKNITTFNGNVTLTYKNIKILSNKIIISNFGKKNYKQIKIYACGYPVIFYHQKNHHLTKGHAYELYFEPVKNRIKLIGNAYIEQINNNISCHKIIFFLKERKIKAYGLNTNIRIRTVLLSKTK